MNEATPSCWRGFIHQSLFLEALLTKAYYHQGSGRLGAIDQRHENRDDGQGKASNGMFAVCAAIGDNVWNIRHQEKDTQGDKQDR